MGNVVTGIHHYSLYHIFYLARLSFSGFSKLFNAVLIVNGYFRSGGLFILNYSINNIDDICCSSEHHKYNNGNNPILLNFMAFYFLLFRLKKHAIETKLRL